MNYTIEKVTTLIGARRYGDSDASIGFILTDSRSLCFPEETLFFALKSDRNNGHSFIGSLLIYLSSLRPAQRIYIYLIKSYRSKETLTFPGITYKLIEI